MSGIYIHIPFCRKACHYCDFHFSTNLSVVEKMIKSMLIEIEKRKTYLIDPVQTIYFGGGTPSLLNANQIQFFLEKIYKEFTVTPNPEITLEANPEDLNVDKCNDLKHLGINRLSIGIQTFNTEKLNWMNRIHTNTQSVKSYDNARIAGFKNISLDLMYALSNEAEAIFKNDLENTINLDPEHISIYGLTIENNTVFGKWKKKGKLIEIPEEQAANQYLTLAMELKRNNYFQYEIANFCKQGFESKHNLSYWGSSHYLGIGPGAHSYNGKSRRFNVRNNNEYIESIRIERKYHKCENLSKIQLLNEYILKRLRTTVGLNTIHVEKEFKINILDKYREFLNEMSNNSYLKIKKGYIQLTPKGFLLADEISLRLFYSRINLIFGIWTK